MKPGALIQLREMGFLTRRSLSTFIVRGKLGSTC